MKVLLISDNENILSIIDKTLRNNGFDTIIYHWLLKALDNIQEISPDYIIVNAAEYPRHWKILSQFITSGVSRNKSSVILYTPENFTEEESKKAKALGITGFFSNLNEDGLSELMSFLGKKIENNSSLPKAEVKHVGSLLARIEALKNENQ